MSSAAECAAPDYCEPVVGWRTWYAVERHGEFQLASLFYRVSWPWLEPLAGTCHEWRPPWRRKHDRHAPPDPACRCGIYAASVETACSYISPCPPRTRWPVVGEVALWGNVVECTQGWRASIAYPKTLYVAVSGRRLRGAARVARCLERYGVPVDVIDAANRKNLAPTLGAGALELEPSSTPSRPERRRLRPAGDGGT
ncbi:MAG: hypothetical protein ACJ747_05080 [Gaiellaceae bacterium]